MADRTSSLFLSDGGWNDVLIGAPNPKPNQDDRRGFGKLVSLYTAYSVEFCDFAIEMLERRGLTKVLDPFAGMGSLGEAARGYPVSLELSDLSPFATLASSARVSDRKVYDDAISMLRIHSAGLDPRSDESLFDRLIESMISDSGTSVKKIISTPSTGGHQSLSIALFIICLARIQHHLGRRGTNPTWTKTLFEEENDLEHFVQGIEATVMKVLLFADSLKTTNPKFKPKILRANALQSGRNRSKVDAIVTSPPYPNRTDYFKHYLPASDLLARASGLDERGIREDQIGTPLIREIDEQKATIPRIDELIAQIRLHPSYASESYYWKGFYYYFSDMDLFFQRASARLRKGGVLLFVVQDTLYKDLYIPVADLLAELSAKSGFTVQDVKRWPVNTRLSNMSPHTKGHVANLKPAECAVFLSI